MKIEIDLNDILGDEYGSETLQESVRRQVIGAMTETIKKGVQLQIDRETTRILNEELRAVLATKMPALIEDTLNAEFTPVSRYGEKSAPTTFRNEIIKTLTGEMIYKKANYDSDKNAFTRAVDAVVGENLKAFQAEFNKLVSANILRDAMAYAVAELGKRLPAVKAS